MDAEGVADRVQEFTVEGRSFVYANFFGLRDPGDYKVVADHCEAVVAKHPAGSLLTIGDVSDMGFNTDVQTLIIRMMAANRPFIRHSAVIGADGVKLTALKPVFMLSGRSVAAFGTKDEAVAWLLEQP
jgi:hypothetical protein